MISSLKNDYNLGEGIMSNVAKIDQHEWDMSPQGSRSHHQISILY